VFGGAEARTASTGPGAIPVYISAGYWAGARHTLDPMSASPSNRRLIAMISPEGRTDEELADEVWAAYQAYQEADEQATEFEPVLDLKREPPE